MLAVESRGEPKGLLGIAKSCTLPENIRKLKTGLHQLRNLSLKGHYGILCSWLHKYGRTVRHRHIIRPMSAYDNEE